MYIQNFVTNILSTNQIEKFNIFLFHTLSIVVEIYLLSNIFKEKKNLHTNVSKIRIIN